MKDLRSYWRSPSRVSELSKEQRKQIADKFLALLEKDKEKNAEWRSKFMKERNKNLPHSCTNGS